jgi:hypothetical protein
MEMSPAQGKMRFFGSRMAFPATSVTASITGSFSRAAWVKTNQKSAVQPGEECGVVDCIRVPLGRVRSGQTVHSGTPCCQAYVTADRGGSGHTRSG